MRCRSDLYLEVGQQGNVSGAGQFLFAQDVLASLLGRGCAVGWSGPVGAGPGVARAVLHSHSIAFWLARQGGGGFRFYPFVIRGGRAGANLSEPHVEFFWGIRSE